MTVPEALRTLAGTGGLVLLLVGGAILVGALSAGKRTPRGGGGPGAASGAFGELVEVFQPSRAHLVAELERKRHDLVEVPGTAPGWDIDLEAGRAVLRSGTPDAPAESPTYPETPADSAEHMPAPPRE